jgi:hypothetical protein
MFSDEKLQEDKAVILALFLFIAPIVFAGLIYAF